MDWLSTNISSKQRIPVFSRRGAPYFLFCMYQQAHFPFGGRVSSNSTFRKMEGNYRRSVNVLQRVGTRCKGKRSLYL